ncbi:MAG: transcriptional regulator GcvA [Rhodospirillales bacterium]|jgi:LysR family glycine cleavage system transcriptional activator|nr:transcriptional regulator GcvA [Rhodospirillales bacterium]
MTRRLPPLNALRSFEAAARHLSFTRAAEELHVTQAAISHQIKALEDDLGLPLFRRLNRALLLTDEGQTLYPAVRDAFQLITDAAARLKGREHTGMLTVSTLPSFAVKWLVPRISRFQDRNPDIDLRIAANERITDLARDRIDVSIRFGAGVWTGVRCEKLVDESITPVCSPALLPQISSPQDLAHLTLLHEEMLPLPGFPNWSDWLAAAGLGAVVDADRGIRFSHTHMMLQAAIDGRGVALGLSILAADDVAAGRLVAPFGLVLPSGYAYYLVMPPAAVDRAKIRAFRDWMLAEMAITPGVR